MMAELDGGLVANNARFLILPWARRPHLASQVLTVNLRRLSRDWERVYGHALERPSPPSTRWEIRSQLLGVTKMG